MAPQTTGRSPDHREEVRLPLTRARAHPPEELAYLVRAFARGIPMGPVAELRTHRRGWGSRDDAGVLMAELVVDEVIGRVIGPEENESTWREVEVELGPAAPPGMLDEVEEQAGCAGAAPVDGSVEDRAFARRPAGRARGRVGRGRAARFGGLRRSVLSAGSGSRDAPLRSAGAARPRGRRAPDAGGSAADAQRAAGLRSGARPRPHPRADRELAWLAGELRRAGHRSDARPVRGVAGRRCPASWCWVRYAPS